MKDNLARHQIQHLMTMHIEHFNLHSNCCDARSRSYFETIKRLENVERIMADMLVDKIDYGIPAMRAEDV